MALQTKTTLFNANRIAGAVLALVLIAAPGAAFAQSALDKLLPDEPIIDAIEAGDWDKFQLELVTAQPNVRSSGGVPVIIYAVETDNLAYVEALLARGARADDRPRKREDDRTALTRAVELGNAAVVKALLDAGADPDLPGTQGEVALLKAARLGFAEIAQLLIDADADLEETDLTGRTALEIAERGGKRRVSNILRAAGMTY